MYICISNSILYTDIYIYNDIYIHIYYQKCIYNTYMFMYTVHQTTAKSNRRLDDHLHPAGRAA